jgi:LPXTG-motif cell wall-anchored protein
VHYAAAMLPGRRLSLAAVVAVALAWAAAPVAHAQGAGDQQYSDPFAGSGSGGGGSSSGGGSSGGGSSGGGSSSSGSVSSGSSSGSGSSSSAGAGEASSASGASTSTGSTSTGTSSTSTLPRTGLDTDLVALAGFGLLLSGVGLRLRLAEARGRRG